MDVQQQQLEEDEFLQEHRAMEEDMEDAQPHRRRSKKKRVVDPEPLNDYPVAHTTLACYGGIMCTWPGRQLMA